eukprot:TRINITY_DN8110_c0_g1_i1.p1 TRINITY_DN8110_c0_g1~~TRINITY_DN8110_c0_g1_i1.p1  ORF type:complete len:254 (-),score=27.96 TRINITY_DN8110_c0_g1_i1:57-818(-)
MENLEQQQYWIDDLKVGDSQETESQWAPWFRITQSAQDKSAQVFPQGNLWLHSKQKQYVGQLCSTRIQWDGRPSSLPPSWDAVAGGSIKEYDLSRNFDPCGNTIVLLSASIIPSYQKYGLTNLLFNEVVRRAKVWGIEHIVSPFRPNEYGKYRSGGIGFDEYANMKRADGLPVDPWLRSLVRKGVCFYHVSQEAMVALASLEEFAKYKETWMTGNWKEISPGVWDCEEVGLWYVNGNGAKYVEQNIWGELMFN